MAACLACAPGAGRDAHPRVAVSDPFARKTAALMWPGAHRAFLIDGETIFNGEWAISFRLMRDGHHVAGPRGVAFEAGSPPCVTWQQGDSLLESTASAVALPTSAAPGAPFIVSLEFELTNPDAVPHDVRLEACLSRPVHYPFAAQDGMGLPPGALTWRVGSATDTVAALGPSDAADSTLVVKARVGPGAEQRWRFLLASHPLELQTLERAKRSPHAEWKRKAVRAWRSRCARASQLAVGDPTLESAVEQALFVLVACTEDEPAR